MPMESGGFLPGFWKDFLVVVSAVILITGAVWTSVEHAPRIRDWWANRRRFSVTPPTRWPIASEGAGSVIIKANRQTILTAVVVAFKTPDGLTAEREIARVRRALPADRVKTETGGGPSYYFQPPKVLKKHEGVCLTIEYEATRPFQGTIYFRLDLAGPRFHGSLSKSVPVVIADEPPKPDPA